MTEPTAESATASTTTRNTYLLDGRRATVADLLNAGLIKEGDELVFDRPRVGSRHTARVIPDGRFELPDGQTFRSPSQAAAAAVGAGSFDGWHAWALPDGTMLDDLRQRLLDMAAANPAPPTSPATDRNDVEQPAPLERHAWLKQARELAAEGNPRTLSVRELLGWWGARRRGYLITRQVGADLANHSLVTSPGFDKVYLDATVQLIGVAQDIEIQDGSQQTVSPVSEAPGGGDDDAPEVGLTVGNLPSALGGISSVSPSATFEEAITLMAINDFSQLPVLAGPRSLRGVVTWKSIARARHANSDAAFAQAIVPAQEVSFDHDLIDILPVLADCDFVLVRDQTNCVAGIVTASDVAGAYGSLATPFFLVGEFDQRLRGIIANRFALAETTDLCDPEGSRGITSFDDMSIGDYLQVLRNKAAWQKLGWPLDRKIFTGRLDEIREIRNDLMHFNPDPLPEDAVQNIRHMINLLREYGG
ncbi:CBS domain-containing protein [Streptomyces lunaelactis]|uniref:restriction system modified-DNA reader domain-containing protein n=1 Tax=Streptomyces lunaelactis TaxID=1535768 RepID=UPI001585898A|nr:CBS domain-containing protein [Streptomyces lunaelactis]NUK32314.1 CBS domain-containing protein [Streptomyces lunaelactis]